MWLKKCLLLNLSQMQPLRPASQTPSMGGEENFVRYVIKIYPLLSNVGTIIPQ